jgi:hypothetical protein
MGEIWLARQSGPRGFDRLVVLKRIISTGDEDSNFESMFIDEARIASSLQHPNIVQVFEFGHTGSSYFLAMEYLPGQSLSRLVRATMRQGRWLSRRLSVRIVAEAAAGLGYAHQRKGLDGRPMHIVHRDVSPQNLHVTYDGHVKVLDFGIAQAAGRITRTATGLVRGKLAYMAPEQALAQGVDARADVFALGMVLFELLTGKRVYGGLEELQILRRLAEMVPLPRVSEFDPKVPPELDDLVARALSYAPEARPADGKVMSDELNAWLRAQPGGEPGLDAQMAELFSEEIGHLPALLEPVLPTPPGSNPTMPQAPLTAAVDIAVEVPPRRWPRVAVTAAVAASVAIGAYVFTRPPAAGEPVLTVWAEPSGAQVKLDGRDWCQAPCSKAVPAGPHVVELAAPGHLPARRQLTLEPGAQRTLELTLEKSAPVAPPPPSPAPTASLDAGAPAPVAKAKGRITLDTDPWTTVFLGKTRLGATPLIEVPLPAGLHRLRLVNETEHIDSIVEVEVRAGATTVTKLAL